MLRRYSLLGTLLLTFAGLWWISFANSLQPLLAPAVALVAGLGAELRARLAPQPDQRRVRLVDGLWLGPTLAALTAGILVGRLTGELTRALPAVGTAVVAALLLAQDRELSQRPGLPGAPLLVALPLNLVAFGLFVLSFEPGPQQPLAPLAAGTSAVLLTATLLRQTGAPRSRVWLLAGMLGVGVAEVSLALGAGIVSSLIMAAFVLLYFYVATGLLQALVEGSLTTRLTGEYSLVALVGLGLLLSTGPWGT